MEIKYDTIPYLQAREQFRPGDVLCWQGKGTLSAGITYFTGSETTHISGLLTRVMVDRPRWLIMEAYEGGHGFLSGHVGDNFLSVKLAEYNGRCIWRPLEDALEPYRSEIARRLWEIKGKGYDYMSLVLNAFDRVELDDTDFFCSEAMQWALSRAIPREALANFPMTDSMQILFDCKLAMVPGDYDDLPILKAGKELILCPSS